MHKVFISYHHKNDQLYKDELIRLGDRFGIFIDESVGDGDIDEDLDDQAIRTRIRDEYLRDSTVTVLLVGLETKTRKHIDWELYSSMFDGTKNKKSGILVINLPTTECTYFTVAHGDKEKQLIYPDQKSWIDIESRTEYDARYPYMPDRIIDNLLAPKASISVVPWNRLTTDRLEFLIDEAFDNRASCQYDMSRRMRRRNS